MIYVSKATHSDDELLQSIELLFQRIQLDGLKMRMSESEFGKNRIRFPGKTISNQGIRSCSRKIDHFVTNVKLSTSVRLLQKYMRFEKSELLYLKARQKTPTAVPNVTEGDKIPTDTIPEG